MMEGMDAFDQRALDVLTSSKLVDALDLSKEDPKVRDRYGDGKPYKFQYDGAPTVNDHLLMARRLVEAGVRVRHAQLRPLGQPRQELRPRPRPRRASSTSASRALVEDLDARGMLDDVTVIVWGEFGRTPRINKDAGRDHWPQVSCAIARRRRHEDGPGDRLDQPPRRARRQPPGRTSRRSSPRSTTTSASTSTRRRSIDPTGRPQYLVEHAADPRAGVAIAQHAETPYSPPPLYETSIEGDFLRAAGVSLALPWLDVFSHGRALARGRQPRRRMVCICTPLGLHPPNFFPEKAGKDYELTPYLEVLKDFRDDFTVDLRAVACRA